MKYSAPSKPVKLGQMVYSTPSKTTKVTTSTSEEDVKVKAAKAKAKAGKKGSVIDAIRARKDLAKDY